MHEHLKKKTKFKLEKLLLSIEQKLLNLTEAINKVSKLNLFYSIEQKF